MSHIPVQIQKVMELKGAYRPDFNCPSSIYAHISKPVKRDGEDVQYAMLDIFPEHGVMYLGGIDPKTKMFNFFDPSNPALYTRAGNHIVNQVSVPIEQLKKLPTLEEVLGIEDISVKRELIPE